MAQILAIDYGERNYGLAISDETETIAGKLPVIRAKKRKIAIEGIKMILKNAPSINTIVIGLPLDKDQNETKMSKKVREFGKELQESLSRDIQIKFRNESMTSKIAEKGRSRKFKKEKADSEAARIILQRYLDHKKHKSRSRV
jgi:putative Holliday junction resolvase